MWVVPQVPHRELRGDTGEKRGGGRESLTEVLWGNLGKESRYWRISWSIKLLTCTAVGGEIGACGSQADWDFFF